MVAPRSPVTLRSQASVQQPVDIRTQGDEVHGGQPAPAAQQGFRRERRMRYRPQLGDRPARARDRDLLSARGAIDHIAAVVAQIPDADLSHDPNTVSHVIQMWLARGSRLGRALLWVAWPRARCPSRPSAGTRYRSSGWR